jgi:hypothetical protein
LNAIVTGASYKKDIRMDGSGQMKKILNGSMGLPA